MDSYSFNGFTYLSNLDEESESELPLILQISGKPTPESILFRLLLGTLDYKNSTDEQLFSQKISYSKICESFIDFEGINPIKTWLNKEIGYFDLDVYFKRNVRNKALFEELLSEFSCYFINKQKENYVSGFLHLYRALEYMSYSFPLAYSSRMNEAYSSYETFKTFFINKEQGQLKFFREFVNILFEKSILVCSTTIDTFVGDNLLDKNKMRIIQRLCRDFDYIEYGSVTKIEYRYLLDFMINLRNSYFHFQIDRKANISNINFNSEQFFEALNDKFANWLSMIYLEIVVQGVYKYNLLPV
jgi:hypothetical protein